MVKKEGKGRKMNQEGQGKKKRKKEIKGSKKMKKEGREGNK